MYGRIFISLLAVFICRSTLFSQEELPKDQLLHLLADKRHDSVVIDVYNELTWPIYSYDQPDSSLYYGKKAIALAEEKGDLRRLSVAHRRIGITFTNIGDLRNSVFHQQKSLELSKKINYSRGVFLALNNLGVAYLNNELLNKALYYFLQSLKLLEKTNDYAHISRLNTNCGLIYRRINDTLRSKNFFITARKFARMSNDSELVASTNVNLSASHRLEGRYDSARFYLSEARSYMSDKSSKLSKFNLYFGEGLLQVGLDNYLEALKSFELAKNNVTVLSDEITLLINIAEQYKHLKDYKAALTHYEKALTLSKANQMYDNLQFITHSMSEVYEKMGNLPRFAQTVRQYIIYKDSNDKINRSHELLAQQLQFDYDKKLLADSVRFEQKARLQNIQLEVAAAKLGQEKTFRLMLLIVSAVILLFALFILNRLFVTRKQKRIIEKQKILVELKNQEIRDSINYAKRLQGAILPQVADVQKDLDFGILYQPKDIIGGDFYFYKKHKDKIFIAVCDCTGHGVPGAIMSVVCHNALSKAIIEFNLSDPGQILTTAREIIIESLNAENQNVKDGMDCSLVVMDPNTNGLKWAGANNPLWILHAGMITELKPNKQPVAFYEDRKEFTTHNMDLNSGTLLYLFTDGYADQFGGPLGKKLKAKILRGYLEELAGNPVRRQLDMLHKKFLEWKGDLDQVDDVAIAIIRV